MSESKKAAKESLWENRDYVHWFFSDVFADSTNAIRSFAIPLIALAVTHSPAFAGLVGGIGLAVESIAYIPGGILADRVNRRTLMIAGHITNAVIWTLGAVLYLVDGLNGGVLIALAAASSLRAGLTSGAGVGIMKTVVPARFLASASSANSARDSVINLVSGPIGGVLIAIALWLPMAVPLLGSLFACIAIMRIRADLQPTASADEHSGSWTAQVADAFRWVRERPTIFIATLCVAVVSFGCNGVLRALVLGFADAGVDAQRIGFMSTAMGVGGILGALIAGSLLARYRVGILSPLSAALLSCAFLLLSFTDNYYLRLALLVIGMLFVPIFNAGTSSWIISQIPAAQIGTISAGLNVVNMVLMPLAPIAAGLGVQYVGMKITVLLLGIGALCGAMVLFGNKTFRAIAKSSEWSQ